MRQSKEEWDSCHIEVRLIQGSRLNAKHGNGIPLFWFKFIAIANSETDDMYVAGRSEKASFAVANQMSSRPEPLESRHQNHLNGLIIHLTNDGWQPDGKADNQWWALKFRRPVYKRQTVIQRMKTAVINLLKN